MSYIIKIQCDNSTQYYAGMKLHRSMLGDMERWSENFPELATDRHLAKVYESEEQAKEDSDNLMRYYQDSLIIIEET